MATNLSQKPSVLIIFASASNQGQLFRGWRSTPTLTMKKPLPSQPQFFSASFKRRPLIYAAQRGAEELFKKSVEVDRLINLLKDANPGELRKLVAENVLSFDQNFWIRLATRAETSSSEDDKRDHEDLASSLMSIVDDIVVKTDEGIESAADVLKVILKPIINGPTEEIMWPPRDPNALKSMEAEVILRERDGQLDELFLSEVSALIRKAKQDGDKPGLEAMLQKVLQLYASIVLSKENNDENGQLETTDLKVEKFVEDVIKAPEEAWNALLVNKLNDFSYDEINEVVKKRIESVLNSTNGGYYHRRVLLEYLRGIQSRAEDVRKALRGNEPS